MNLLLDTHVLLWWLDDDPSLSPQVREQIADPENTVYLSAVVVWEIRIKQAIGKLGLPSEFRVALDAEHFVDLPVTVEHAHAVAELPPIHRDPFDRMLVAQASLENLHIVTRDARIASYEVGVVSA